MKPVLPVLIAATLASAVGSSITFGEWAAKGQHSYKTREGTY